jgi:hypothetical protein
MGGLPMIIAVDPSGTGTTGICRLTTPTDYETYTIAYSDAIDKYSYWSKVIAEIKLQYHYNNSTFPPVCLVVENFVLYPNKAGAQSYDTLETARLLGALEYTFEGYINWQLAAEVMKRWSKDILEHEGIIKLNGRRTALNPTKDNQKMCEHELDALRHAVHAYYFKKEKLKQL